MRHKLAIQFVLFLMLAVFASLRLGLLHDTASIRQYRSRTSSLYRQIDELEKLRRSEATIYRQLTRARNTLAGASKAYLPDLTDTYAWTTRQVRFLAQKSGVQIQKMQSREGPRLRAQRGKDSRQFSVLRCQVEFSGSLEQMLDFIQTAEERNPHLVVCDLRLGPQKLPDGHRNGSITVDWPTWRTPDLREELLAEIDPLDDLAAADTSTGE